MARSRGRWLGIVVAAVVVGALALLAAEGGSPAQPAPYQLPPGGDPAMPAPAVQVLSLGDVVALTLKFGVVVALLGASLWLLRRYAGPRARGGGRTGAVSVVDTISLAQGRTLYVLDVGDRALVVGATPHQFSLLGEVSDARALERLRAEPERVAPPLADLSQRLTAALQSFGANRTRQDLDDAYGAPGGQPANFAELLSVRQIEAEMAPPAVTPPPAVGPRRTGAHNAMESAALPARPAPAGLNGNDGAPGPGATERDTSDPADRLRAAAARMRAARTTPP